MADEATVMSTLSIRKTSGSTILQEYQSRPGQFRDDVNGTHGPTPGAVTCTTLGTNIDLSQLTIPGWCRMMNLDSTNFVEYGIHDPEQDRFYPFGELGPGHQTVFKFSRNFAEEYFNATGTGTTSATNRLMIRAHAASCNVLVEAFEK